MYRYLIGKVVSINTNILIIEINNIGYEINIVLNKGYIPNKIYKFHVYELIKENEYSLYGFDSNEELNIFKLLVNVKGVGPKIALKILEIGYINVIEAINNNNIDLLTSIKGIGIKVSQLIIFELSTKVERCSSSEFNKALNTLTNIGINKADVLKFSSRFTNNESEEEITNYILRNYHVKIK